MTDSCGICRYFVDGNMGGENRGLCRAHPPGIGAVDFFPGVRRNSWCGEFQPRTVSDKHLAAPLSSPHEIVEKELTARLMKNLLEALVKNSRPPPGKRWSDDERVDVVIDDKQKSLFPALKTGKKRGRPFGSKNHKKAGRPAGKKGKGRG